MVGEIPTAISSFKGLLEIVRGLKALNTDEEVRAVRSALYDQIVEAQTRAMDLSAARQADRERIAELEKELEEARDWSKEKKLYELTELGPGAYAYLRKQSADGDQSSRPPCCTNCFAEGKVSILQYFGADLTGRLFLCPRCKSRVTVKNFPGPSAAQRLVAAIESS